ncbi:uncharacterized protein LOC135885080, partial [Emys orbicularis]|uniref:uncharacterized protein LOC135885080 n=1 Tax=Emys orbicularis TaxID=82168 RepID=UPI0031FD1A4E
MRETWEQALSPTQGLLQYVLQLQGRLAQAGTLARENLKAAQEAQAQMYNREARVREFQPGDRVLLLLPSSESKLLARWQGPYAVIRKIGPVTYEINQPDRRKKVQRYHVNLLKPWREREGLLINPCPPEPELGPRVTPTEDVGAPQLGESLTVEQRKQTECLLRAFRGTFTDQPGYTTLVYHNIQMEPGVVIRESTRLLPYRMRQVVEEEVRAMLELGVIEPSQSEWRSPVVLVPKPDGTQRFCIDFRRVNSIPKFDAYPMPRVDELLDRLGKARFLTTLDLCKGYWQIPLDPTSQEKTAFATASGLYQFTRMPFGLHGAPATFQRLMDRLLLPHREYVAAYLDDVVIYSDRWESHLEWVAAVLRSLRAAGLTANPKKCRIGWQETTYLGYTIGGGQVKPLVGKVQALAACPPPTTKRHVRQFLGLAGYYRRFIPDFASIAAPLTELLTKTSPRWVEWTPECDSAFRALKDCLCREPVLYSPDFDRGFVLQTDASESLAHSHLFGGHLGVEKTLARVLRRFFWPGVHEEVRRYCASCPACQLHSPHPHLRAPLVPLPIIEVPFERIAMDLVGPLEKTARGHQYILVVLDYATRYPEAVPLRNTASKTIAKELVGIFARMWLPKEILTDQGTPFMSKLMKDLCTLLHIHTLRTLVYHPQTDGLVERFNR